MTPDEPRLFLSARQGRTMMRRHQIIAEIEAHRAALINEIEALERTKHAHEFDEMGLRDHDLIATIDGVQRLLNGAAKALRAEAIVTWHANRLLE